MVDQAITTPAVLHRYVYYFPVKDQRAKHPIQGDNTFRGLKFTTLGGNCAESISWTVIRQTLVLSSYASINRHQHSHIDT